METNEVLLPGGYKLFEQEGVKMVGNTKEEFAVKNRSFLEVDTYFSQEISKTINELLNKRPVGQIQVLDLAGGTESQAVKDIEIEKEFGNRVLALNIDFSQNIEKGKGALRVQGDATQIPLADSSIDIVYSRQFLPFIMRFNPKHNLQIKKVITEVARVLKPGGIAFLDDEEELSGAKSDNKRQQLANEFGVILETRESLRLVKGNRNFPKFWGRSMRPEKFLVMRKL
jgi:ubiquinone/menaquinone biosynthesis C-methylase UbiE